ncbi:MAG: methylenetetrahydrofolate reductase [Spirochaetota bacterium]
MKSGSNLEKVLEAGHFAVTGEIGPPTGPDIEAVHRKAESLRGVVDAINVTDSQSAMVRMSSMSVSAIIVQAGLEPIMQMTCRDRNRIAMQADILGAVGLGIRNLTCISGDHQSLGNQKGAKKVFDLDSMQLLAVARRMRDEHRILGGEEDFPAGAPLYLGAAASPFTRPLDFQALRLAKKIEAGADYVQTQCVYDIGMFEDWMASVRELGLHKKIRILAGVMPLKSAGMARHMAANLPGIVIPAAVIERLAAAPKGKGGEVGLAICAETIQRLRAIEGLSGIHVMAIEWEHRIREIVETAGLLPRPLV